MKPETAFKCIYSTAIGLAVLSIIMMAMALLGHTQKPTTVFLIVIGLASFGFSWLFLNIVQAGYRLLKRGQKEEETK